jgi:membrane protease YdiL (CAAX protease family)
LASKEADVAVSPAALLLALLAVTVLVAGSQAWLVVLVKIALARQWLPRTAAEHLAQALQAVGVSPALPLIPFAPRRPVPWGFFDILAITAIWLLGSAAAAIALRELGWLRAVKDAAELTLSEQQTFIAGNLVVSLLIVAIGLPMIAWRTGARPLDFGWSPRDAASDIKLGLIGFVMLAPPVYALQGLLVQFWQPSKHPLVEMFKASPNAAFFGLLFVSAAVVAPLFEELVFRVLLQGYLEKAFAIRPEAVESFLPADEGLGVKLAPDQSEPSWSQPDPDSNPYAPPRILIESNKTLGFDSGQLELRGLAAWLPIAISSLIFALMHYSHGPDWIPLTFLAAGMGYLYHRTHRLLPSLIVHVLINSSSLLALWVQVFDGK